MSAARVTSRGDTYNCASEIGTEFDRDDALGIGLSGNGSEIKWFDVELDLVVPDAAAIPSPGGRLLTIAQGVGQSDRIGRSIRVCSVEFTGFCQLEDLSTSEMLLMYLILDTQCNGANPTVAGGNTGIFTNPLFPAAFPVVCNKDRFHILSKRVLTFDPVGIVGVTTQTSTKLVRHRVDCDILVTYDGSVSTGAVGSIHGNHIFWVVGCSAVGTNALYLYGTTRIRFVDL